MVKIYVVDTIKRVTNLCGSSVLKLTGKPPVNHGTQTGHQVTYESLDLYEASALIKLILLATTVIVS